MAEKLSPKTEQAWEDFSETIENLPMVEEASQEQLDACDRAFSKFAEELHQLVHGTRQ